VTRREIPPFLGAVAGIGGAIAAGAIGNWMALVWALLAACWAMATWVESR
jgi:hypothetical protein